MDRDIFISYIEEDGAVARALASELRTLGQSPWIYEEDGVAGISYLTQVHRAIEACRAFVLVASHKSVNAHQVIREVEQAHEREKIIIPVRLHLTHQQFTAANPILQMASGTAVTLAADEGNIPAIAKRIAATLRFAEPQGRETPGGKQSVASVTITADAPSQAKAVGQNSSTEAEAALRPQGLAPEPPLGRDLPGGSVLLFGSVALGIFVLWLWAMYFCVVALDLARQASESPLESLSPGSVIFGAATVAILCGVFLLRSFAIMRRSPRLARTQFRPVTGWLACTAVAAIILNVLPYFNYTPAPTNPTQVADLLAPLVSIALISNGLRVLRKAADAASG